ncbi:hypothetical protein AVEN_149304-1 [Araneus ventricosus]|uniref:Uncharacterized protein n=1 Tax=Araneus ventricosus TaxID=182803 RepID=A0A4Y2KP18_ARAVE|nr:hypothetical protein AVEN_149304-1 [Araneus ventricosus]
MDYIPLTIRMRATWLRIAQVSDRALLLLAFEKRRKNCWGKLRLPRSHSGPALIECSDCKNLHTENTLKRKVSFCVIEMHNFKEGIFERSKKQYLKA